MLLLSGKITVACCSCRSWLSDIGDFKLEKGPTDKVKEPDLGGFDH